MVRDAADATSGTGFDALKGAPKGGAFRSDTFALGGDDKVGVEFVVVPSQIVSDKGAFDLTPLRQGTSSSRSASR